MNTKRHEGVWYEVKFSNFSIIQYPNNRVEQALLLPKLKPHRILVPRFRTLKINSIASPFSPAASIHRKAWRYSDERKRQEGERSFGIIHVSGVNRPSIAHGEEYSKKKAPQG